MRIDLVQDNRVGIGLGKLLLIVGVSAIMLRLGWTDLVTMYWVGYAMHHFLFFLSLQVSKGCSFDHRWIRRRHEDASVRLLALANVVFIGAYMPEWFIDAIIADPRHDLYRFSFLHECITMAHVVHAVLAMFTLAFIVASVASAHGRGKPSKRDCQLAAIMIAFNFLTHFSVP